MDRTLKQKKEVSDHVSSECDETEPDGDSMWSTTTSVAISEAESDNSTLDSALRDLPTVRASKEDDDDDDEIQRLILAAEALVVERARLKMSSPSSSTTLKGGLAAGGAETASNTMVAHLTEAFSGNKCGAANSGYFTDTENALYTSPTLSGERSVNMDICGERDHHSVQSRESVCSTPCDSVILSKVSNSSLKVCNHLGPENNNMAAENQTNIPRLSLEVARAVVPEERLPFNKVEKEACNSSIRGSSGGSREAQKEHHARDSERSHFPEPPSPASREGGQAASVMVHEEGSCLLNLALSATSSLKRLTRLVRQVGTLHLGPDTPRVVASLLEELGQHEAHQQGLEAKLTIAATKLQSAVAEVRGLEGQWQEHRHQTDASHHSALGLLEQVEAGLESCGLSHMLAITSPRRRCSPRVLEDVGSAVALLTGELNRRMQRLKGAEEVAHQLRKELQSVREVVAQQDSRTRLSEAEARQVKQQSQEDLLSLRQCLAQAESTLTESQLENARLSEEVKKQTSESSAALAAVQKKLYETQHMTETRVSDLERELHVIGKEKQHLEASVRELKEQLTLRTQQVHLVEDENSQLIDSLRSALRQQQAEMEQLRHNLESISTEKNHLSKLHDELKQEAAVREEELEEARGKYEQLKRKVVDLEEEQRTTQKHLQHTVDGLSSERSDLEAKLRAQDFAILQLRTELEMEKVQTRALTEEAAAQGKKARDLQECLWTQAKKWRSSSGTSTETTDHHHKQPGMSVSPSQGSSTSLTHSPESPASSSFHKVERGDEGSLSREEQLQSLLQEKDVELQDLHQRLSTQISKKNQELELLTNKLGGLEEQLYTLVKGLEASATLGDITTEVGLLLQERTQHLDSLHQSSRWLQEELSSLALENQTLNSKLVVARKLEDSFEDAQENVRRARQEAREERVASARLREDCARLQAQLDQMHHTLHQERQERKISAVVNGVKHNEFSSLLENATAALNQYQT
ncbi:rootletin-like isoform X3 [Portunus trituberculatus]|uniref:rootletin-like isoform X3 n=1 Tax=Portunus trituberculatus TaxID=210409 RepID=UPI001E1CB58A|nr:rootletin-like isoform X3 [Portunus trituberculatus]